MTARIYHHPPRLRRSSPSGVITDRHAARIARLHYWHLRRHGVQPDYARTVLVNMLVKGADSNARRIAVPS